MCCRGKLASIHNVIRATGQSINRDHLTGLSENKVKINIEVSIQSSEK